MESSLILYASHTKLSPHHQPVITTAGTIYIRAYERIGESVSLALDHADPDPGEIVLNSIPSPRKD
jgi:hypothetical protein